MALRWELETEFLLGSPKRSDATSPWASQRWEATGASRRTCPRGRNAPRFASCDIDSAPSCRHGCHDRHGPTTSKRPRLMYTTRRSSVNICWSYLPSEEGAAENSESLPALSWRRVSPNFV